MAMQLDKIVPFGRSLDEYRRMFRLTDGDLESEIVGIGDGPASFNAEMHALGKRVLSIDPLYVFTALQIENQFYAVLDNIINQVRKSPLDWTWTYHRSPDDLRENRIAVFEKFLSDYESGLREGRYSVGELPKLELPSSRFDIALCSHFLFLYSDHLTYDFHRDSVLEMLRIAKDVRIFPLLTLTLKPSPYLEPILKELRSLGYGVSVKTMDYELQRGGNQMLLIKR